MTQSDMRRIGVRVLPPALILAVNTLIYARLFRLDWSAYLSSDEGTFIAIAKEIAAHPRDLIWWPVWNCGLPFQNTYLPGLHLITAALIRLTGISPALAFHHMAAAFLVLGPVFLYVMAERMTGHGGRAFYAALAWSIVSPCVLLTPIRADLGGAFNLRRLHVVAYYGEAPHTASLAVLPLAILFLYRLMKGGRFYDAVLAGLFAAITVLLNAFGAVVLMLVCVCLLATTGAGRFRRNLLLTVSVGVLAWFWISPLLPPSVIADIRRNSVTIGGDYHFSARMLLCWLILAAGFALLWLATRRRCSDAFRFFLLFAWLVSGITSLAYAGLYAVPQPERYHNELDLALSLLFVFGGAALLARFAARLMVPVAVLVTLLAVLQTGHDMRYARHLVRGIDITRTPPYRMARWADARMHGQRMMISGAWSFWFNNFTETPQLEGGQDPMQPNYMIRVVGFTLYSGMNAGSRDAATSILWMKALGTHAISVPGPQSSEPYHPFQHPRKFDGLLPVLWREGDETIYAVPARSESLAHVVPAGAIVRRVPIHGLDTADVEHYVRALDDASLPEATWTWQTRHSALIHADIQPGQVISVQTTWTPGWRATVNGVQQRVHGDGIGMLVIEPVCTGPCDVELVYNGGLEWSITRLLSVLTMLGVLATAGVKALAGSTRWLDGKLERVFNSNPAAVG